LFVKIKMNLVEKINQNTELLFASFLGLSNEQLIQKPNNKTWSVIENTEHIFLVDVGVSKVLTTNHQPKEKGQNKTELYGDSRLETLLVNRSFKVTAPTFVSPQNRFSSAHDAEKSIRIIIDKIIWYIGNNDIASETITIKHAALGEMTKTDWVHFLIHHTYRHILQIEEAKKDLGFV
jgi:DinB superfamily